MATSCLCDLCNCGRHRCVEEKTSIYQKVNASTDMPTEYTSKYPIYESYEPRASTKPQSLHVMQGRLDTVPTSQDHYQAWDVASSKREPVLPHNNYHLVTHKFGGRTAYQEQFEAKPKSRRESIKPKTEYVMKGRLTTVPTSKDHYQAWGRSMRTPILPHNNYHLVTHKFGGKTAYQEQFQPQPPSTRESLKPKTEYVMKGRLTTVPTSKDHFQAWGPCKRTPVLPHNNYHLVTHKFGGATAYQDQYKAQPKSTRESIPPYNNLHLSRAAFSGENKGNPAAMTTYGTMFERKKINVCPASFSTPPGFVFTECDDRGHRCFRKVEE